MVRHRRDAQQRRRYDEPDHAAALRARFAREGHDGDLGFLELHPRRVRQQLRHERLPRTPPLATRNLALLELGTQSAAEVLGCDPHPSLTTHQKLSVKLVPGLESDLGW